MNTEKIKLTKAELEDLMDQSTTFALACLMVEMHTYGAMKDQNRVANAFLKSGVVLKNNQGYVGRLRKAQSDLQEAAKAQLAPEQRTLIDNVQKAPSKIILTEETP